MNKFLTALLFALALLCFGCGGQQGASADGKMQVAASFYPMAEFARAVGGDRVTVYTMIGDGIEPHDWEPSARDLTRLAKAKVFVYNGGVEPWAQPAVAAVADDGVQAVEAGQAFMQQLDKTDPHFWLSPRKADAAEYIAKINALDEKLTAVAQNAKIKTFITTHAAFGHLAADYGLRQESIMGLSPQAEPSPAALNKLLGVMQADGIKYVFFETLVSPRIAETIAQAAGAETLVLDPLEGLSEAGRQNGDDYLKIMERNIENLNIALNGK